ncbi:MAG: aromatic hydrocarbon degradation protein [Panacagrimonas sp.]|nr:aromatic hydrocarbon degradation protein [Panacagrimonas sp.]
MESMCRTGRAASRTLRCGSVAVLVAMPATGVWASNGLNLVGFGAESLGLGSADIAVSRDANAVNINPAGMTQIAGQRLDGYVVPFYSFNFSHSDAYNDDYGIDNPFGIFGSAAYVTQGLHPDLRFGIGLFASGGTGINYDGLRTRFGTRDEYSAVLAITKVATAVAWQANPRFSVGLGINVTYSSTRQKVFPDTSDASDPAQPFFGLRIDGADGLSWNGRIGIQYKQTPNLTLGMSYATETDVKLRNGTATFNYEAIGLGRVKYRDTRIDGFALAREWGAGFAWQFTPRWMLAGELTWLDWSGSLNDARLYATRPDDAAAPKEVSFAQSLDHRDQYIWGAGLAYQWSDRTTLRGGVNISPNAVPNRTLTPTLNLTADGEIDLGFTHKLRNGWEFASAMQLQSIKKERYDNPEQPFGPAKEDYGVIAFTLQLSRSW